MAGQSAWIEWFAPTICMGGRAIFQAVWSRSAVDFSWISPQAICSSPGHRKLETIPRPGLNAVRSNRLGVSCKSPEGPGEKTAGLSKCHYLYQLASTGTEAFC